MMTSIPLAYSASFDPVRHKGKYVPNECLQISFSQKVLETEQTSCFVMIFMSVGHSLSFSSLRRITNSGLYESFEKWIYLKVARNCSNHLFRDDFDVIMSLNPVIKYCHRCHQTLYRTNPITSQRSCSKSRFVRSCMELTKPIVLS